VVLEHPRDSAAGAPCDSRKCNPNLTDAEGIFSAAPPQLGYRGSGFGGSFIFGQVLVPNIDNFSF
jgi:hypothetical protein